MSSDKPNSNKAAHVLTDSQLEEMLALMKEVQVSQNQQSLSMRDISVNAGNTTKRLNALELKIVGLARPEAILERIGIQEEDYSSWNRRLHKLADHLDQQEADKKDIRQTVIRWVIPTLLGGLVALTTILLFGIPVII